MNYEQCEIGEWSIRHPAMERPEHLFWRCYVWDSFGGQYELLKYFKYCQVIATRACYPNMNLSSEEASLCCKEIGKREEKKARERRWEGERK